MIKYIICGAKAPHNLLSTKLHDSEDIAMAYAGKYCTDRLVLPVEVPEPKLMLSGLKAGDKFKFIGDNPNCKNVFGSDTFTTFHYTHCVLLAIHGDQCLAQFGMYYFTTPNKEVVRL